MYARQRLLLDAAKVVDLLSGVLVAMNPIPMLRELLEAVPFKPFVLCLTDGRKLPVEHPDFLTISRHHRILWEGRTEEEFAMAMPLHVTGVEPFGRRRRKRAA